MKKMFFTCWLLSFTVLTKVMVGIPGATPFLAVAFFSGRWYSLKQAFGVMVLIALLSNALLALGFGNIYYLFGSWVFWQLSGMLMMIWFGNFASTQQKQGAWFFLVLSTSLFWAWTNLSAWWTMYPHSFSGFLSAYMMALPFLRNMLLASLIWFTVAEASLFSFTLHKHHFFISEGYMA